MSIKKKMEKQTMAYLNKGIPPMKDSALINVYNNTGDLKNMLSKRSQTGCMLRILEVQEAAAVCGFWS